jgi:hypothetical protein
MVLDSQSISTTLDMIPNRRYVSHEMKVEENHHSIFFFPRSFDSPLSLPPNVKFFKRVTLCLFVSLHIGTSPPFLGNTPSFPVHYISTLHAATSFSGSQTRQGENIHTPGASGLFRTLFLHKQPGALQRFLLTSSSLRRYDGR